MYKRQDIKYAQIENLKTEYARIDLANIARGAIKTAMIGDGVVGSAQIADGSITNAKIVELSANKITAGVLSVERLIDVYKRQQDSYEKVGNGVKELQTRLEEAKKKMEDMKKSSDSSKSALSAQQKEIDELSAEIKKGENNYTTAGNRVKDWETKLNTAETQVIRANKALDKNAQYMQEAENSADHCATSIDQYGKLVKKSTEITAEFGEKLESAFANKLVTDGIDTVSYTHLNRSTAGTYCIPITRCLILP